MRVRACCCVFFATTGFLRGATAVTFLAVVLAGVMAQRDAPKASANNSILPMNPDSVTQTTVLLGRARGFLVQADGDLLNGAMSGSGIRRVAVSHWPGGWTIEERWTSAGLKPCFSDFVVFAFGGSIRARNATKDGKG